MADKNQNDIDFQPTDSVTGGTSDVGMIDRLKNLPRPTQIVLGGALVLLLYSALSSGGDSPEQQATGQATITTQQAIGTPQKDDGENIFVGVEADRPELIQTYFEQNRREISALRADFEDRFETRDKKISNALAQNAELQREMQQMIADFTAEIRSMEASSKRDRDMLGQLAEDTRNLQMSTPSAQAIGGQQVNTPKKRRARISQTPLSVAGVNIAGDQALLSGFAKKGTRLASNGDIAPVDEAEKEEKLPFLPPLGFVRATMLNGVDALVGGQLTPALVRLSGVYKTAMNSTVNLDGCFALVEFEGNISTERAMGKPSRMTCVYPDQGAVTYSISGYLVDAVDGIIGVPGVFYEGDASRIAAAVLADFAAGVAEIIETNQSTFTVDSDGTSKKTITGDELRAELAGGVENSVGSLRDYLFERANRVLPFIRLDATRELNMVLMSGIELRSKGGSPWTLLFDAESEN